MTPFQLPMRYRLIRPPLKAVFRMIFHILGRVTVTGQEHIPYGEAYLAAMNHISIFDPPLAASFWPEQLEIIGAADVFDKPGQGQILKLYGVIPVHRGEYDRELMRRAVAALKSGRPLLVAPEGGRSHVTAMRRAKPGIAYLVEKTGVPVVPVGLVGTTDDFWQRARRGERPHLEVHIGEAFRLPPIPEARSARREARQHNADLVMCHLARLLPEAYRGVYAGQLFDSPETDQ